MSEPRPGNEQEIKKNEQPKEIVADIHDDSKILDYGRRMSLPPITEQKNKPVGKALSKDDDFIRADDETKEWIRDGLENVEKTFERRRKEAELTKKYNEEHTIENHSNRFQQMVRDTRQQMGPAEARVDLYHIPGNTVLTKEYKENFTDRLNAKERAGKKENKKSRLYQKKVNRDQMKAAAERQSIRSKRNLDTALSVLKFRDEKEDIQDVVQFLGSEMKGDNMALLNEYYGKSNKKGPGGREGQDVQKALDRMVRQLFSVNLNELHFENDTEMVKNAAVLERLSRQVAAFDRLSEKNNYGASLNDDERNMLNERLEKLRSIAAYYNVRKEIIMDDTYKDHYNDELSMNMLTGDPEQRKLAGMLLESYVLAQNMLEINGIPANRRDRIRAPRFTDPQMAGIFENTRQRLSQRDVQKKMVADSYKKRLTEEAVSDEERLNSFLKQHVRRAFDLDTKGAGYECRFYSKEKTQNDVLEIENMLKGLELGTFKVAEKELAKAKLLAVMGRNKSHLLLNYKADSGDSKEMKKVKNAVLDLEKAMTKKHRRRLMEDDVKDLNDLYENAMEQCRNYINTKNPWTKAGERRKAAVEKTLSRLVKESDAFNMGRKIFLEGGEESSNIRTGTEILYLAALQDYTDRLGAQHADNEVKDLEAEYKLKMKELKEAENDEKLLELKEELEKAKTAKEKADEALKGDGGAGEGMAKAALKFFNSFLFGDNEEEKKEEKKEETSEEKKEKEKKAAEANLAVVAAQKAIKDREEALNLKQLEAVANGVNSQLSQARNRRIQLEEQKKNKKTGSAAARQTELLSADEKYNELPDDLKDIADIFRTGAKPVTKIANSKSLKNRDRRFLSNMSKVQVALSTLESGKMGSKTIMIGDHFVRFFQDRYGNLNMETEGTSMPCAVDASKVHEIISDDIMKNSSLYGYEALLKLIDSRQTDLSKMSRRDVIHTRDYCKQILHELTGVKDGQMNNFSSYELKNFALRALAAKEDKELFPEFKKQFIKVVDLVNKREKEGTVNTVLNLELQQAGIRENSNVVSRIENKDDSRWGNREKTVRDLAADLLFSSDSVMTDSAKKMAPGERMRQVLLKNRMAIGFIIGDQYRDKKANPDGLIESMLDRMPLFLMSGEQVGELKSSLNEALKNLRKVIDGQLDEMAGKGTEEREKLVSMIKLGTAGPMIAGILDKLGEKELKKLEAVDKEIDKAMKDAMENIQAAFDSCVDEVFETKDEQEEQQNENLSEEERLKKEALNASEKRVDDLKKEVIKLQKEIKGLKKDDAGYREKTAELNTKEARLIAEKKALEGAQKEARMYAVRERMRKRKEEITSAENALKEAETQLKRLNSKGNLSNEEEFRKHELENEISVLKSDLSTKKELFASKSGNELSTIIEDSMKGGKKGQSLFMKNVLKTYFKSMPVMDQRSMIASALRNSNPMDKMTRKEIDSLSDEQKYSMMSDLLGGMFKGAGPLFQKMLQGLPKQSLPKGLRKAVEDTQDSLAPMPEAIVKAHMESICNRSDGKIERIEIVRSLGAASVGQAFLCKIYGPDMAEGKDVVIKLLRSDARNRMMREKEVMLKAARMTDEEGKLPSEIELMRQKGEIGGMESTYLGNLQRIEEELDLTIEAKNCEEGQVYDKVLKDEEGNDKENLCDSMKLSNLVKPTSDTLMMEIAGTKTVKKFMSEIQEETEKLLWKFCVKTKEKDKDGKETGREILMTNADGSYVLRHALSYQEREELAQVEQKLISMHEEEVKKQAALAQMAEKWVTEGIFKKGYYHGDLHAGNVMISEKGVTVIDFGNATILSDDQKTCVTKMMVAASQGDVKVFRHNFHLLLENTPEEVYQAKRDELTLLLTEIMEMGDEKSCAERIAAALVRAQEIGLELPPVIANFSSCQMRLQNTISDMNNSIKVLRKNLDSVSSLCVVNGTQAAFDPLCGIRIFSRGKTAKEKKHDIETLLRRYEFISREDFRKKLRDKDDREHFMEFYEFRSSAEFATLNNELDKIDKWLRVAHKERLTKEEKNYKPTKEEKDLYENGGGISDILTELARMKDKEENPRKKAFYMQVFSDIGNIVFAGQANNVYERLHCEPVTSLEDYMQKLLNNADLWRSFTLGVELSPRDRKLEEYYTLLDSYNGKLPEDEEKLSELEALENEVYRLYKAEKEEDEKNFRDSEATDAILGYYEKVPNVKELIRAHEDREKEKKKAEEKKQKDENKQEIKEDKKEEKKEEKKELTLEEDFQKQVDKMFAAFEDIVRSCGDVEFSYEEARIRIKGKKKGDKISFKEMADSVLADMRSFCKSIDELLKNKDDFEKKFSTFRELMTDGRAKALHKMYDEIEGDGQLRSNKTLQSFLDVMSDVMQKYKYRVMWRLDKPVAAKLLWEQWFG